MKTQSIIPAIAIAMLAIIAGGCNTPTTPQPNTATPIPQFTGTIVAMGNSLTEGLGVPEAETYPAILAKKLQADGYTYQVINAGISGETSSGARSRIAWVLNLQPDIVILETGANDGLRAIEPTLTEQNLNAIIDQLHENGVTVVLAGMQTIQNLGQDYTDTYQAIYPRVAAEQDIILIPFFLEGVAADPTLNQTDGIHPTGEGYQIIAKNIYPHILQAINTRNP